MVSPILTQWTTLSEDFVLLEGHHGHGIA
ncbi:hypothetical protein ACUXSM_005366, partial [Burkholderia sp. 132550021-2]